MTNNLSRILDFLSRIEKLKTIQRRVSISDNSRKESPAEHTWRVGVMAMVLHRELNLDIDLLKTLELILVHDIVEVIADDVWITDKSNIEEVKKKLEKENKAAGEIFQLLPDGIGENLLDYWREFEQKGTLESVFANALDKIEVIIQRLNVGSENREIVNFNMFETLYYRADESVSKFPQLKDFWSLVQLELKNEYENKLK